MSSNEDYPPYIISFINGSPGLAVRADNSQELENRLKKVLPIFKKFKETVNKKRALVESNGEKETWYCKMCGEEMVYREGMNKVTGKKWRGFFCPNSTKKDNHPVQWV